MQHPQAKLIPPSLWKDYFLFNEELPDSIAILMQASKEDLTAQILATAPEFELNQEQECAWLALALSHPELSCDSLREISRSFRIDDERLFKIAVAWGNVDFFESLVKEFNQVGELDRMIAANDYAAFRQAADCGHLPIMEHLMQLAPDNVQAMIAADDYAAFRQAADCGHLPVMERLMQLAPDKVQTMIAANNYRAFHYAALNGHLSLIERLMELVPEEKKQTIIAAGNYSAFRAAAANGHLPVIKLLVELVPEEQKQTMIAVNDYAAFGSAAANGHLLLMDYLIKLAPDKVQTMIAADEYVAFRAAARNGQLPAMELLIKLAPDKVQTMIAAYNDGAFHEAAEKCQLPVMERLVELVPEEKKQSMIAAGNYGPFYHAVANGNLPAMEGLMKLAPNKVRFMIAANYHAFDKAAENGHLPVVNRLLTFPAQFAYAELHDREYGEKYIHPFVSTTLTTLRAQKAQVEQANPDAVFDITNPEEAKLYFYMLRNLIRRNLPLLRDDILFLLEIPSVKALVHTAVTPQEHNELLRLALSTDNQSAAELLLTISAVRALAEENNYYRDEMRGGLDLAALARDRESSMHALTTGEQQRLQAALERYEPSVKEAGVPHMMQDLRQTLERRYETNPAKINRDNGSELCLPLNWKDFLQLNLNSVEKERALTAYYQHKDHTALRYLSKPNHWMDERAGYVYISNDRSERWSTFEEYQPLIALLYVGAADKETSPIDGYTLDTRLEHFIRELAYIGRAHNWDKSRIKTDARGNPLLDAEGNPITEEYDDLQGDKPSCFSGVKRRLFQSVQGHPLFKMLTKEVLDGELRELVYHHFEKAICDENRKALQEAWSQWVTELDKSVLPVLKTLDITPEKQQAFIDALAQKYGPQFTKEPAFIQQIRAAFQLKKEEDAHILNFDHFGIHELLTKEASSRLSSAGFFANSIRHAERDEDFVDQVPQDFLQTR
ncbi:ankyrin repeat domain-containing protein [Legionella yabuuchiae]|uniref:ankyrin repeat domain-containing protein n=1 Tax=Legionella yabuuchiae TaxID=376727 RepID=UPI001055D1A5|nr:ankyrin repeat domain-containing protein [Legionella yabuuchiae]